MALLLEVDGLLFLAIAVSSAIIRTNKKPDM